MNKLKLLLSFLIIICYPQVGWSRSSLADLEARLEVLENKLESNLNFDLTNKVESLQQEIQELRGIIEEQQHANVKVTKLEPAQAAYNSAYQLIEDKNFSAAIVAFKDFLLEHNSSKYAPNATYWLGELYLTDHRFDVAAEYFLQVVNRYKDHNKAPDALLKLGMLEIERENWQGAKDYFMQIKQDYANSSRVIMADAKLQSLQRDGH